MTRAGGASTHWPPPWSMKPIREPPTAGKQYSTRPPWAMVSFRLVLTALRRSSRLAAGGCCEASASHPDRQACIWMGFSGATSQRNRHCRRIRSGVPKDMALAHAAGRPSEAARPLPRSRKFARWRRIGGIMTGVPRRLRRRLCPVGPSRSPAEPRNPCHMSVCSVGPELAVAPARDELQAP